MDSQRIGRCSLALGLLLAATSPASAGTPVGSHPIDVAVDPIANRVYVANRDGDSVSVVDGARLTTDTVPVGDEPVAVAVDPVAGVAWVASAAGAMVTRIAGSDLSAIPVPLAAAALQVAVHPSTGDAWVSTDAGTVIRIDAALATQTANVTGASFLAIDWLADRVWVAGTPLAYVDGDDLEVHEEAQVAAPGGVALDPVADRVCASQPAADQLALLSGTSFDQNVATGAGPAIVAIDPIAQRFYAVNRTAETVTLIENDLATGSATIGAMPGAVAANPNTGHLYVLEPDTGRLAVVDGTAVVHPEVGTFPASVALNPVTNRIFVANASDDSLEVLDGSELASANIDVGLQPNAVAVDMQRDRIYVANSGSDDVSVIDGTSNALLETVGVGDRPVAVAVDVATGTAFVANADSDDVSAIERGPAGTTTQTIAAGDRPTAIAVNPVTGAVYVANRDGDSVTVIEPGAPAFTTRSVAVGDGPLALAVDAGANRVFVANEGSDDVTRIDGATLATLSFPVGDQPLAIAIDPRDGVAYVASFGAAEIAAIDGSAVRSIGEVTGAAALAVDPTLDRVYVANSLADDVSAIDLATGTTERVKVGPGPLALALDAVASRVFTVRSDAVIVIDGVALTAKPLPDTEIGTCIGASVAPAFNPVTGRVYVPSCPGGAIAVINELRAPNPLGVAISGDAGVTNTTAPTLQFAATTAFAPNAPPVSQIYYQIDSAMGRWTAATPSGAAASATLSLAPGPHVVYAFAVDGHEAASSASPASLALVGGIRAAPLIVVPAPEPAAATLGASAVLAIAALGRRR